MAKSDKKKSAKKDGRKRTGEAKARRKDAAAPVSSNGAAAAVGEPEVERTIPAVRPLRAVKLPSVAERKLGNGLRVVVARRPGVPRFEARMLVPFARGNAGDPARRRVMAKSLLSGTGNRTSVALAEELQALGGALEASAGTEDLVLAGSALATNLRPFLEVLADVVEGAAFPKEEVALERDRVAQEIALAASQPETVARDAFVRRLYGSHPYGRGLPDPHVVRRVTPATLQKAHAERVRPEDSVLVLVGDLSPNRALDAVERALGGWATGGAPAGLPAPRTADPGAVVLVDRPGAVQTNVRIGGPAVGRTDPDYPALALANLVFGGYFTSRLVDNIREEKGYTYSPGSGVQQMRQASHFVVQADVGVDVTLPALVEIRYELLRMIAGPFTDAELTAAKRYLAGTLSMGIQTQSGLASYLATLAAHHLPVEYLRDFPASVERLGAADVLDAARRYLDPRRLHTVLVGPADQLARDLAALAEVEVQPAG